MITKTMRKLGSITAAVVLTVSVSAVAYAQPVARSPIGAAELIPAFDPDLPVSGTTAYSDEMNAQATWVCSVYASDPSSFANTIEGEGWQSCSGFGWQPQRINVVIQRYLGLGFWQNRANQDSGYVWVNFVHRDLIYDCSGTGSQLYRVVTNGYAQGGAYYQPVQSENYLRYTCPQ
ncbi:hypothetical protein ONR57_20315 [Hoyosella sp. YIM 151337]|uniref:hypothetical protein n=1 Tax=Hoyosella sp. YIM 151337 TaxID=2992742 RepID=UPI0022369336|nr:hypothetical protein [Hoyosella sp. YIM 151337]MCW4355654.1 hypothetical protein [Hoyosella sp. YIM 151337]